MTQPAALAIPLLCLFTLTLAKAQEHAPLAV
jgi:hypothetical protein